MEQNAYKNELNQVAYTEAGRAALTEALLEARPAPRRRSWTRRLQQNMKQPKRNTTKSRKRMHRS